MARKISSKNGGPEEFSPPMLPEKRRSSAFLTFVDERKLSVKNTFLELPEVGDEAFELAVPPRAQSCMAMPSSHFSVESHAVEALSLLALVIQGETEAQLLRSLSSDSSTSFLESTMLALTSRESSCESAITLAESFLSGFCGASTSSEDFVSLAGDLPAAYEARNPRGLSVESGGGQSHALLEAPEGREEDKMTTVMLRNLPPHLSQKGLCSAFTSLGFEPGPSFDFLYVPCDFALNTNFGYAFVNFLSCAEAARFSAAVRGVNLGKGLCEVAFANNQGLHANVERFRNSPVNAPANRKQFLPLLFSPEGEAVAFPLPDRAVPGVAPRNTGIEEKVFVGGLAPWVHERDIREAVFLTDASVGAAISNITLARDSSTSDSRGYAFVSFRDGWTARSMIDLSLQGRLTLSRDHSQIICMPYTSTMR